jgi:hypothetical protein
MAIDFPNSPSTGQSYTVGEKTWVYSGSLWELVTVTGTNYHGSTHGVGQIDAITIAPSQVTGTALILGDVHTVTFCTSSTRPITPTEGQLIYETDTNKYYGWNGTIWSGVGGGGASYQSSAPGDPATGDLWVDSDAAAATLNENDFKLKADAILDQQYTLLQATMGVM